MNDTISKLAVIQIIEKMRARIAHNLERSVGRAMIEILDEVGEDVGKLPPVLGTNLADVGTDCISRQQAIDALRAMQTYKLFAGDDMLLIDQAGAQTELMLLPSAQPEIIYCKDCKHFIRDDITEYTCYGFYNEYFHAFCDKHWDKEQGEYIDVKLDDYCSFAERREDAKLD